MSKPKVWSGRAGERFKRDRMAESKIVAITRRARAADIPRISIRFKCPAKPPYNDKTNPRFSEAYLEASDRRALAAWLFENLVSLDNATGLKIQANGMERNWILVGDHIETLLRREKQKARK